MQNHPAGGGLQGDGVDCRVIPEDGATDASADRAGLVLVLLQFAVVVDIRNGLIHTFIKCIEIQLIFGEFVIEALFHQVLAAEFHRIHPDGPGNIVRMALDGPHGLRNAVPTHSTAGGLVGIDRIGFRFHDIARIQLREAAHALGHNRVPVGTVRALVGIRFQPTGCKRARRAAPRR